MRLSVIIPAQGAERELEPSLAAVAALDPPPFEVIVVDDASEDASAAVAERSGARVLRLPERGGAGRARNAGAREATGDVLTFVDADVLLPANAIETIVACFRRVPAAGAVTGRLDGASPVEGYFTRYKNRYMEFVFSRLPETVDFLYTSIAAVRREVFPGFIETPTATEDTELGMRLSEAGVTIVYCRELAVVHLKRHSLASFYRNDFRVPFSWARVFLARSSPGSVLRKGRFAHAGLMQILGLGLASASALGAITWGAGGIPGVAPLLLALAAVATSARFLIHLGRHEGLPFALAGVVVSFVDQLVMSAGVLAGSCSAVLRRP
jgi:GT2 family glycosyltransferase